jgi:hypothetical protein
LIECCKLNSVDPYAYLADVLAKIVDGHLNSAIDDLLPWAYVTSHSFKAVAENSAYARAPEAGDGSRGRRRLIQRRALC